MDSDDKILIDIADKAVIAKKIKDGSEGQFIQEMAKEIAEGVLFQLCHYVDLSDHIKVVSHIEKIKFLKYGFANGLTKYIQDGEMALDELQNNNKFGNLSRKSDDG